MDGSIAQRAIRTTCPYCGVGCGVVATPDGRGGAAIAGDATHPANAGRLCSKGTALGETLSLDERLLHPEVNGKRASWDAALDAVAEGFRRGLAQHGPDGVALYVSGQLLTEDYYAANRFAKGVLGTANIDSNSRLCMASAVAAHIRAFGEDVVPGVYDDLELADTIVLVGSNLAWCHPVLFQRIQAAKARRPTMQVIVVDPRRTATCEGAALHLPLRPGSDVALFASLLVHLADHDHAHAAYLGAHTEGAAEALAAARSIAPRAAEFTGLDPAAIARFCAAWARSPRTVTLWSQGVNQSSAGTDKANAIINCHLLTGRIGTPGAGPFSVTGQPNAMGGRETGALATMLAGHLRFDVPAEHAALAAFWRAPALPTAPGLKATQLFAALAEQRIGALWVMATNPAVSLPNGDGVRAALARAPFLVVSETTRRSDTAGYAHVRLPALAWGEKDGTVTNSERVISRQRGFLPWPGDARPDWWAVAQVAARLGTAFGWKGPAAIFREHAAVTGLARPSRRAFDISGLAQLSDAQYDALAPTRWPVPPHGTATRRFFAAGGTLAPRACLVPTPFRAPVEDVCSAFPLRLLTGRLRDQWHSMTRTGTVPRLMAHAPEPVLTLHPQDAAGLPDGGLVEARSARGSAVFRLALDEGQRRGTAFAPMHWTAQFAPAARVNALVAPHADPVSFQPELKNAAIRVAPFAATWHAFLLLPRRLSADIAPWCAAIPVQGGAWRHELAGSDSPAEAFARLRSLIAAQDAAWQVLEDAAAGVYRAAVLRGGRLLGAVLLGPDAALPPRAWLSALMAGEGPLSIAERAALLAGILPGGPPASPLVCACHGVSAATIRGCGAPDVDGVGAATGAGTGCGSCRPEIAVLIARQPEDA
ncbi:nitrate reductase [Roseomonas fluvialis]|uniref:Nitrate reductase n=1 Tax=Roseomonas fluvialis TaxID=1750527 RepID=A0ABN6P5T6_9PROT|nr:nitrate reductase [Roseomonas fluvialis]BDG73996.1 nitrate reductase [Roseomonas fluvialis]